MSHWKPISESEIWDLINQGWIDMSPAQRRLWEVIKIDPIKWEENTYGDVGGGFWVVAIYGSNVIWYNDIEDGFNRSTWTNPGKIDEYWCNQDELQWAVQNALNQFSDGGPPSPLTT